MTTVLLTTALLLTTTSLFAAAGQTNPNSTAPVAAQPAVSTPTAGRFVTIVNVKAPWYAFDFLLAREFRKVVPTYQAIDGLRFKAFSSIETDKGKFFGGIYLWDSEANAKKWYTPKWFADVEQKRGHRPTVEYFPVISEKTFVPTNFDYRQNETDCVTLYLHALKAAQIQQCLTAQPGLLRTYIVAENTFQSDRRSGSILLFDSDSHATAFLKQIGSTGYDWFNTPTLLNNPQPTKP